MDTQLTSAERIIRLGEVIARNGIAAVSVDLLLLAHDARDAGVEPVLVDVMIDESMPEVVRERAFVLVGSRLVCLSDAVPGHRTAAPAMSAA